MRLLVTRPAEDAAGLAALLTERGHEVLLDPLLDIRPRPGIALPLDGVTGLVFTSTNGVRAFRDASDKRDVPVFAVGDRTAHEARTVGFALVTSADGDIESLAALIAASQRPGDSKLLHITGTVVAGDLAGNLRQSGFNVDSAPLYEAIPATALGPSTCDSLKSGGLDGVLLFSPRTAWQWSGLLRQAGLESTVNRVDAWCLSEAVAVGLGSGEYRSIRVAARPTQASLLDELDKESN